MDIKVTKEDPEEVPGGAPKINSREVTTKVRVAGGNTIVIGGVYEKKREFAKNAVPVFSKIPLLGWLFKYETTKATNNKLLIFITPEIVDNGDNSNVKLF
jgi:type IV pilus assembly protein PilQ